MRKYAISPLRSILRVATYAIFSLLLSLQANAQNTITVTLKDGTEVSGPGFVGNRKAYLNPKEAGEKVFTHKNAVRVTENYGADGPHEQTFAWKTIKSLSPVPLVYLLKLSSDGEIQLLKTMVGSDGLADSMGTQITWYVSKKGEEFTYRMDSFKVYSPKFKQIAKAFFSDCPELMKKLEAKKFDKRGVPKVVRFYNENCG